MVGRDESFLKILKSRLENESWNFVSLRTKEAFEKRLPLNLCVNSSIFSNAEYMSQMSTMYFLHFTHYSKCLIKVFLQCFKVSLCLCRLLLKRESNRRWYQPEVVSQSGVPEGYKHTRSGIGLPGQLKIVIPTISQEKLGAVHK